jgi:phosphoribosylglycinamide formyltransferase-1
MPLDFFLITEPRLQSSYLVNMWMNKFGNCSALKGLIIRDHQIPEKQRTTKESFHQQYQGQKNLNQEALGVLYKIYPNLSKTELAMINTFGVSPHSATYAANIIYRGDDLNTLQCNEWLTEICSNFNTPFFFIFIDQILAPWWIEITHSRIINSHPAVLPYARGMYAIENIAISQNREHFCKAAGATVHYIDAGIDTGPIIRAEQFLNPLSFDSIWEYKAKACGLAFELLIRVAQELLGAVDHLPVGTFADRNLRGPNFKSGDFTPEAWEKAERGYLSMKALQ